MQILTEVCILLYSSTHHFEMLKHVSSCKRETIHFYLTMCICVCVSCLFLSNSLISLDCSPPGSSVHGILQARILEWVAMPSFRGSSPPRDQTCVSYVACIASGFFTTSPTWEVPFRGTHYQLILKVSRLLGPYLWFLSLS